MPPKFTPVSNRTREIGLTVVLGIQGLIMFVVSPLASTGMLPPGVTDVFRVGLAATAVFLLTRSRLAGALILATFIVSILLTFSIRAGGGAATAAYLARIAATAAFDIAVGVAVAHVVFADGPVSIHRIMGAVILYLSIGLVFANAYRAAALTLNHAFNGISNERGQAFSQLIYFSLTTLTTTGYGDIAPVHPFVRSLANLEAVIGQLYPATLLARLVTLHSTKHADASKRSGEDR